MAKRSKTQSTVVGSEVPTTPVTDADESRAMETAANGGVSTPPVAEEQRLSLAENIRKFSDAPAVVTDRKSDLPKVPTFTQEAMGLYMNHRVTLGRRPRPDVSKHPCNGPFKTNLLWSMANAVAQGMGRSIGKGDFEVLVSNDPFAGGEVADYFTGKPFFPLSVTQIDVEKARNGVLASCKELTPELIREVAETWRGGPLKDLPKRLGHYLKLEDSETGETGNYPLSGYHHFKMVKPFDRDKAAEDCHPDELIVEWQDNTPRTNGDTLGRMLSQLRYDYGDDRDHPTIFPLPLEDLILYQENQLKVEEEKEQRTANREAERDRVQSMVAKFSAPRRQDDQNGGGEQDHRGDKRFAGTGYRHPRRDRGR